MNLVISSLSVVVHPRLPRKLGVILHGDRVSEGHLLTRCQVVRLRGVLLFKVMSVLILSNREGLYIEADYSIMAVKSLVCLYGQL